MQIRGVVLPQILAASMFVLLVHCALFTAVSTEIYNFILYVRFEVFMAVTMKNAIFWDVTPCGYCKSRRFGGT
jgi:hypothetical protein